MPRPTPVLYYVLCISCLLGPASTRLAAQYDGALSPNWGAGDGFATWQGSGRVFLETAVATSELLYGVGDYDFPAGTRSLHFQAVDKNGEVRSDRSCRDSTGAFGAFTDESGGEAAIFDSSGHLLIGGWMNFQGTPSRLHALLARYEIDQPGCTLDEDFSTDGFQLFDTQSYCDSESCVIVGLGEIRPETGAVASPRIVALLRATVAISNYRYFLIGLTSAGAPDLDFGAPGSGIREITAADLGTLRSGATLTVDDRGRIVVLLTRLEPGTTSDLDTMAFRYTPEGAVDVTFGAHGLMAIRDHGIDDNFDDSAVDLLAVTRAGRYFATVSGGSNSELLQFDADSNLGAEPQSGSAAQLVFQGNQRFLQASEDPLVDGFLTRRKELFPDHYDYDPTYGSDPDGFENYDLDVSGGSGQQIVDFLLWGGRPIVVGTAVDGAGDSWGFLMRAENHFIFADGFEGGTRARWWGY